ncbi:methanobactin export MATE transporter MbnM [Calothrix rhizosoleniae]|uniref:methanobactin export MATE transporter MbnM n=1 Tax=Calothrix rhizosoleniae TaxID=888997 RepID=UPI000B4A320F|nr:methanobactin export MATE transporter MbnM [Calothrix rhizosoleniae]
MRLVIFPQGKFTWTAINSHGNQSVGFKRWLVLIVIFAFTFCVSICLAGVLSASSHSNAYVWDIPDWMPKPLVPLDNPMNKEKVELGRHIFYEKRLSSNGEFSCASCHIQARAFSEPKQVSVGVTGEKHPRNSMTLANVAYNSVLTWADPGMKKLEVQALVPMFGEHPVEMGLKWRTREVLMTMLKQDSHYQKMFAEAFGKGKNNITIQNLTKSLAAFQRSLISANSPYDRYRYGGDKNAISQAAKRGEVLFNSEKLQCFQCHSGFNFSDSIKHEGIGEKIFFHNTGLYNLDGKGSYPDNNTGIYKITRKPSDMGKFKVPTLRNIELTAPYMHDGSIATLEEVIDHYAAGGRTIVTGKYAGVGSKNPLKSELINGFQITPQEKQDLIEFLRSLMDESFIQNPSFSDPNTN